MGNKLTFSQFAQLMSGKCNIDIKVCEAFLKTLFRNITGGLDNDEIVKIKDFGTFKVTSVASRKSVDVNTGEDNEIPAHRKVVFVPAKELAIAVNRPFEMFETLEISDDLSESEIMEAISSGDMEPAGDLKGEENMEPEKVEDQPQQEQKIVADATESVEDVTQIQENDIETESDGNAGTETLGTEEPLTDELMTEDNVAEDTLTDDIKPVRGFKHGFIWGIVAAFLIMLIGAGVVYYLYRESITEIVAHNKGVKGNVANEKIAIGDMIDEGEAAEDINTGEPTIVENEGGTSGEGANAVPTKPSDTAPVYDTITDTRYLTTMAKDHYGNYHLWPYIYEENSKMLGHPNRIKPGTRIVIPDLQKYGVDPKNPADIEKAKKMGGEIYSRYR